MSEKGQGTEEVEVGTGTVLAEPGQTGSGGGTMTKPPEEQRYEGRQPSDEEYQEWKKAQADAEAGGTAATPEGESTIIYSESGMPFEVQSGLPRPKTAEEAAADTPAEGGTSPRQGAGEPKAERQESTPTTPDDWPEENYGTVEERLEKAKERRAAETPEQRAEREERERQGRLDDYDDHDDDDDNDDDDDGDQLQFEPPQLLPPDLEPPKPGQSALDYQDPKDEKPVIT